jgi:hypothetical protein
MNATSVDVRHILENYGDSSGLDLDFATNLFIGREPAEPDNCVTIFDTVGFAPYLGLTDKGYEYPSIQIRVRNRKYIDGWTIIEGIKTALHGLHQETWNGTLYCLIACSSGPALLDWDDKGRCRFIINFNVQRRTA